MGQDQSVIILEWVCLGPVRHKLQAEHSVVIPPKPVLHNLAGHGHVDLQDHQQSAAGSDFLQLRLQDERGILGQASLQTHHFKGSTDDTTYQVGVPELAAPFWELNKVIQGIVFENLGSSSGLSVSLFLCCQQRAATEHEALDKSWACLPGCIHCPLHSSHPRSQWCSKKI